jgi:siroheme decarboxylase
MEPDAIDKRILFALQGDLGDSPEPYKKIAEDLDISEKETLSRIRKMLDEGVIRRIGAMIRHIEAGIGFNGMVVWKVPPERTEEVGNLLGSFPEVTHCYERPPFSAKGGTVFTMVHAVSEEQCLDTIRKMARKSGIDEYEVLFSERELKKVSMTYFDEDAEDS